MRVLIVTVLAVCLFPASAGAVELVNPDGSVAQPYQTWADRSKMPTPSGRIVVYQDVTRCGYLVEPNGCASPAGWMVSPLNSGNTVPKSLFFHELGHMYDYQSTQFKRDQFASMFGGWDVERFANAYAECSHITRRPGATSVYNSTRFYRRLCATIRA